MDHLSLPREVIFPLSKGALKFVWPAGWYLNASPASASPAPDHKNTSLVFPKRPEARESFASFKSKIKVISLSPVGKISSVVTCAKAEILKSKKKISLIGFQKFELI